MQAKPNGAKIVYLNHDMTEAEIAGLYAACDCLVHPYRGEGYGLPIAEAMACGKPTIVTDFGAALDFANPSNAYLIPADTQRMTEKKVGDMATVDYPFWANPNRDALTELLRHVVANRDEANAKGAQAARDIAARHTWEQAAQIASARIQALSIARIQMSGAIRNRAADGIGKHRPGRTAPGQYGPGRNQPVGQPELAGTAGNGRYVRGSQAGRSAGDA